MKKYFFQILFLVVLGLTACREEVKLSDSTYVFRAAENLTVTLNFDDRSGQYFGRAINRYFGTYRLDGEKLILGPASSTMMSGNPDKMAAEEDYLNRLGQVESYRLTPEKLTLTLKDGRQMIFAPRKEQEDNP